MDTSFRSDKGERYNKSESRRHRSRSTDSEEDRQRRRRRKEREAEDSGRERRRRDDGIESTSDVRDSYVDRDRKRRRSRSPGHESSRRHDDRDSKHRSRQEHSPGRNKRERSFDDDRSARNKRDEQISRKSKGPLPSQAAAFQGEKDPTALVIAGEKEVIEKQKPNFAPTGLLAAASNSISQVDGTSIVLKYHEPAEARKPPAKDIWKLYVFKGPEILETIELSTRSCWLVGRELAVVDMAAEHPSISKQHAVLQFRYVEKKNEFGDKLGRVRPYLIDLESANGTLLNKDEVPPSRYLELRDKDMIQFGHSTREYVLVLAPKDIPS